jgi:hypothetical protein
MSKSRWEEYKEKNQGTVSDLSKEDPSKRLSICNSCEHLIKLTKECKKDKSFVLETVKIKEQQCPIGAW